MECDRISLRINHSKPRFWGDDIWKYERLLRKTEYYNNCKHNSPIRLLYKFLLKRKSMQLGFSIPLNTIGPGLSLAHAGPVLINSACKIGSNCRIQTCVTCGTTNGSNKAPIIGDNCYLGDGCKIIGNIRIANDCCIGANAVVVKTIEEAGTTWGGYLLAR